jgi:uncharacterized membrane protein YdbT with pleckstrin-like domain
MPYPTKLLNPYETVAVDLHPHWWYFAEAAVALLASIVVGVVVLVVDPDGTAGDVLRVAVLALVVISALWVLVRYLKWITTNFVITSDRLIFNEGIFAKRGIEIPLERVNNVNFSQGFFERIIGAGDLLIESGGEAGQQRFTDVRHPQKVKNKIHAEMESNEQRKFGGGAAAPIDVADQIDKLAGLLDRGLLSPEEFEAQKRKLLDG